MVTSRLPQILQKKMFYPLFIEKITLRKNKKLQTRNSTPTWHIQIFLLKRDTYLLFILKCLPYLEDTKKIPSSQYSSVSASRSSWSEEVLSCWQTWLFFFVMSKFIKTFCNLQKCSHLIQDFRRLLFYLNKFTSCNIFFSFNTIKVGVLDPSKLMKDKTKLKASMNFSKDQSCQMQGFGLGLSWQLLIKKVKSKERKKYLSYS